MLFRVADLTLFQYLFNAGLWGVGWELGEVKNKQINSRRHVTKPKMVMFCNKFMHDNK